MTDYRLDPPDLPENDEHDPNCPDCQGWGTFTDEDEDGKHLVKCNCTSPDWRRRLATVRAKHEREGGPDEQELADMGRTS